MSTRDSDHFETKAIHAGQQPDPTTGAVMTPVYLTSTYAQSGPGEHKGFEYSRTRNPTRDALQGCLAALESGKHGLAFASGLAATDAVLHLLSSGDHVVLSDDLYGGTFRLADKVFKRLGIEQTYVDVADPRAVEAAFRPNTKLLWVETPTNPMLKICDLAALAEISRKRAVISVCDNTFATPFFQRPLELGFDVVAHSMTKYLNGHSDVVAGALVLRRDGPSGGCGCPPPRTPGGGGSACATPRRSCPPLRCRGSPAASSGSTTASSASPSGSRTARTSSTTWCRRSTAFKSPASAAAAPSPPGTRTACAVPPGSS